MVLIYLCLTLHTTQGKRPNTAVFALLHPILSALSGGIGIGSAQQHSCKFAVFSGYLGICSVRKHACKAAFFQFFSELRGGKALPPMYRALCHVSEGKLTREVAVQYVHRKYKRVRA